MSKALQRARSLLWSMTSKNHHIYDIHMSPLTVIDVSNDGNKVHCQWKIHAKHLSPGDVLHGGCTASIFDEVTGYNIMVATGKMAVSSDINVSYLRPAHENEVLDIYSKVTKQLNSIIFLETEFLNEAGKLVVLGKHNAVIQKNIIADQFYGLGKN